MKSLAILAGASLALLASHAQAAVFNVFLDGGAITGGGTITIDDSLITPNGSISLSQATFSIEFDGHTFDPLYPADERILFDAAGWEIAGWDDEDGQYADFYAGLSGPFLAFLKGGAPGEFWYSESPGGGLFSITRADNVVPLPAAFWLFGSVLGAGALARRRRAS